MHTLSMTQAICTRLVQVFMSVFSAASEPCQWLANQHHSIVAGKVLLDSDIMRRVEEAEARQRIQQNEAEARRRIQQNEAEARQRIWQNEAEARIAELSIQQNRGSQTTQTAQKLGSVGLLAISHKVCQQNGMFLYARSKLGLALPHCLVQVWMKRAHKVMQLSCLPPLAEDASIVRTACTAVLSRFQTTPDPTGRVFASKLCSVCMPSSRTMCDHNSLPLADSVNAFWLGVMSGCEHTILCPVQN